ncbi:MAG TPA: MarR family winged helix-turn-helix transcriptional regulator [Rhizomicrobium sp.]|nr:MarR family winged helix-turn-helix transcriptional regulator [Rhizomicrobium sp.]
MTLKGPRKTNGNFELAETPSHLMRRCHQFYGDLYAREVGGRDLTKQQYTVLCALEHNDGASQTALVETTGIDRSTLAEMVRRMLERGLLSRERTEEDQRANAVAITPAGRKSLRAARIAADRAERALLEPLPPAERMRFVKSLVAIAAAMDKMGDDAMKRPRRKLSRSRRV